MQKELSDVKKEARKAFRNEDWKQVISLFQQLENMGTLEPDDRVLYAVALARESKVQQVELQLSEEVIAQASNASLIRTRIIRPALKEGNLELAETLLRHLHSIQRESFSDHALLASVLVRTGKHEEAIDLLVEALHKDPANIPLRNQLILILLQSAWTEDAATIALQTAAYWQHDARLAHLSLQALMRTGRLEEAYAAAEALLKTPTLTADQASMVAQYFLDISKPEKAKLACKRALQVGEDSARLRYLLARAQLLTGVNTFEVRVQLRKALDQKPNDLKSLLMMGELLLKSAHFAESIPYLEKTVQVAPKLMHAQVALAQAFIGINAIDKAAKILQHVVNEPDVADSFRRLAIAMLARSGQKQKAMKLYQAYLNKKRGSLPADLGKALRELARKNLTDCVPKARLEWAYYLSQLAGADIGKNREKWEKRACWGYEADRLIANWMETRPEQVDDLAALFGDTDGEAELLRRMLAKSKCGIILASAHIGPLYAGPVAVYKQGIPFKWVASMPGIFGQYGDTLISVTDMSEVKVSMEIYKALGQSHVVMIAIDGAGSSPAASTIPFAGQQVTYSDFAARICHRLGIPSAFGAPYWEQGFIRFRLRALPMPNEGESEKKFVERWTEAFFAELLDYFRLGPENLRLSGGIWRSIA